MNRIALPIALMLAASAAPAQDRIVHTTSQSFDDVVFGLENAILDRGLVISATHHVAEMLDRTRADVGSDVVIFDQAEVFSFCSATLSRKVMEADPMNIAFCPYTIFVATTADDPGTTHIGYRSFPDGPMAEVQALLEEISQAAIGD